MVTIMKQRIKNGNFVLLICITTAFAVAACSTTGMQRSENVQSSMQAVDNDIKQIVVQIDAINASLEELTKPGQADRKRAFDLFSENSSKIEKMEKDFTKHAEQMESSGKTYFNTWDKNNQQYDNPDIQQRSDERREELGETYDKIARNNEGVKEAFQTYVSDVTEIERFLSNDLTDDGMNAISRTSNRVVNNGSQLRRELQNLQGAIEDAREKMRQN